MESIFKNEPINITALPRAEEVEWIPIQKKYLPISLLPLGIIISLLVIGFVVVQLIFNLIHPAWLAWVIFGTMLLFFSFLLVVQWLGFKHKAYSLREHDILYRSGLIFRKKITVPFNRIQHSEITQGLLETRSKLAKLLVFTAGGSQSDLCVPGLTQEEAQNIKAFINEKIKQHE